MAADASPGWMVPSARLWRMRLTQVAVAGPVLAVIAGVAAGIAVGAGIGATAAAGVAVAAGIVLRVERRRYRAWAYREREEDRAAGARRLRRSRGGPGARASRRAGRSRPERAQREN